MEESMQPEEFRQRRRQLGYTQAELAAALGTTQAAISYYEAGRRRIPQPVARLLDVIVAMRQGGKPTMVHARPRQPAPDGRQAPAPSPGEAEVLAPYVDVIHNILHKHGAEGCFSVIRLPEWMREGIAQMAVYERFHDGTGRWSFIESPAALRKHLLRVIPGHKQTYHQSSEGGKGATKSCPT